MRFADSLWLSATATQRGWNQMVSYSAAFYGTAALQTWKLGMDAPLAFWQAVGRAGDRPTARTPMRPAPARKAKPVAAIAPTPAIAEEPAGKTAASSQISAAKPAKAAATPAKAAAKPLKAAAKAATKPVEAVVSQAKPATRPVKAAATQAKAEAKPIKAVADPGPKAVTTPTPAAAPAPSKTKTAKASKPKAAKPVAAAPKATAAPVTEPKVNTNPRLLDAARGGKPDDLTVLSGVGDKLVTALNDFGIFHFDQIAELTEEGIDWINAQQPGFKALTKRFDLVAQAKARKS